MSMGFLTSGCLYERLCEHERFELFRVNEIQRHINTIIIIIQMFQTLHKVSLNSNKQVTAGDSYKLKD